MPNTSASPQQFIASAALPAAPRIARGLEKPEEIIGDLPDRVVAGSNLMAFGDSTVPEIRSSVVQALLFAQLVADKKAESDEARDPSEWYSVYRDALNNLGWVETSFSEIEKEFDVDKGSVHRAIVPFLTAAFGPAAAVGGLIVTALQQLDKIDEDSKWITLFERESKRFEVSDFQFSTVDVVDQQIVVQLAGAVLSSDYGKTQVLFFKFKGTSANFRLTKGSFSATTGQVESLNAVLRAKLAKFIPSYIEKADIGEI